MNPGARFTAAAVVVLLAVLALQLFFSGRQTSQTIDEAVHIFAAYRHWRCADFGTNPEQPPLVKLVAGVPLLFMRLEVPAGPCARTDPWDEFTDGRDFLYANDAETLLRRTRLMVSIFAFLLALLVFRAADVMFGRGAGLLALALFVFEPNLLAHGAIVSTDVGVAFGLFAAVYAFYRYVKRPTSWRLLVAGFAAGLALATKHSGALIFPILLVLAAAEVLVIHHPSAPGGEGRGRKLLRLSAALVAIMVIAVAVLWATYGFRFAARPGGEAMPSFSESSQSAHLVGAHNVLVEKALVGILRHRLLPEAYVYGGAFVLFEAVVGSPTFVLGKLYPRGVWFYFPVVLAIKCTLGFLLLLLVAEVARKYATRAILREILFLGIPMTVFLGFAMASHHDVGVRHIFPVFPFLIVRIAGGAWKLGQQGRAWAAAMALLLVFHAGSSLRAFPNYLAYSNEAWGGPARTYRVLSESSVDWGQGLKAVRRYLDDRHIRNCWFAYYGSADPAYYQIPCQRLPGGMDMDWDAPIVPREYEGTVLISASQLPWAVWGPAQLNPYAQFQNLEPVDQIADSIFVYRGRFDLKVASAISHVDRAWRLGRSGQFEDAIAEARQAVALLPESADAHYALAHMLARTGQIQEAGTEQEIALALARRDAPAYHKWLVLQLLRQPPPAPAEKAR